MTLKTTAVDKHIENVKLQKRRGPRIVPNTTPRNLKRLFSNVPKNQKLVHYVVLLEANE